MPDDVPVGTRRRLMHALGISSVGLAFGGAGAPGYQEPSRVDTGGVKNGHVTFPNWRGEAEPRTPPPAPLPPAERVGYAIVALGRLSLEEILPAFGECRMSRPVTLISGSPDKARTVARQYGISEEAIHAYAEMEKLRENLAVQAVYVVMPNAMRREYTLRAAAIGRHVLCEKPMANSVAEAREMVEGCAQAGVRLMIAYRCQYEPYNGAAIGIVRSGELGKLRFIEATNVQAAGPDPQWRHVRALAGGGALPDIGLYCLNVTRYLTEEKPSAVSAPATAHPATRAGARWRRASALPCASRWGSLSTA